MFMNKKILFVLLINELLLQLLGSESSVTSRGAVSGLGLCLGELLHSWHAGVVLAVLPHLVNTGSNLYWLVKVRKRRFISLV